MPARRFGSGRGSRPLALGHHGFAWLYVVGFVQPHTGEVIWYLCSRVNKAVFEQLLVLFARESGAGRTRHIVLVLDNAGWHGPEGLVVADGMTLVFLPPYSSWPSVCGGCWMRLL